MPTFADAVQFFGGQFFGATTVPADIDLTGKTILITGGNTGLGLECAKQLVNLNVTRLILACRDTKKGETAKQEILAASESATNQAVQIDIWDLDLSQYSSVKSFGERLQKDLPRLDGFIANAGVEMKEFQTAEGLEMSLTVNVISTFMTGLLALPVLRETAKTHNVTTNLVFVGSLIHAFAPDQQLDAVPKDEDIFEFLSNPTTADMETRYPLTKLIEHQCFVALMDILSSRKSPRPRSSENSVTINLVNPGWCRTDLGRHKAGKKSLPERIFEPIAARTAEQGGRMLTHAVVAGPETHGKYLSECVIKEQSSYVRSDKGRRVGGLLWTHMVERIRGEGGVSVDALL